MCHFRSHQRFKNIGPREVAMITCLHVPSDAHHRPLQCILATSVHHLLFDLGALWTPATNHHATYTVNLRSVCAEQTECLVLNNIQEDILGDCIILISLCYDPLVSGVYVCPRHCCTRLSATYNINIRGSIIPHSFLHITSLDMPQNATETSCDGQSWSSEQSA